MRSYFGNAAKLHEKMAELDYAYDENSEAYKSSKDFDAAEKRWSTAALCLQGMEAHLPDTMKQMPASMQLIVQWMIAVKLIRNIAMAIAIELKPAAADPIADGVFDAIDTDSNEVIDVKCATALTARTFRHQAPSRTHTHIRAHTRTHAHTRSTPGLHSTQTDHRCQPLMST